MIAYRGLLLLLGEKRRYDRPRLAERRRPARARRRDARPGDALARRADRRGEHDRRRRARGRPRSGRPGAEGAPDRKSTRLNSSHLVISYAVFCLKKKKTRC